MGGLEENIWPHAYRGPTSERSWLLRPDSVRDATSGVGPGALGWGARSQIWGERVRSFHRGGVRKDRAMRGPPRLREGLDCTEVLQLGSWKGLGWG